MLNNPYLEKDLHYQLIKPLQEPLQARDFSRINKIILSPSNINSLLANATKIDFEKLLGVDTITIEQLPITNELVALMNQKESLEHLYIGHCRLQTNQRLTMPIHSVTLNSVDSQLLELFENTNSIAELTLLRIGQLDMEKVAKFCEVERMNLYRCNVLHTSYMNQLSKLKKLQIEGTNFDKEELLGYLPDEVAIIKRRSYMVEEVEID